MEKGEQREPVRIVCSHITKKIRRALILDDISLELSSGHIYGLQGYNGSGKTMLMRALSGLMRVDRGEIRIDGKLLGKDITFPDQLGLLLESPAFLDNDTGYQNLKYLADIRGRIGAAEIRDMLEQVGLSPDDKRKYRKYSLGMKQRLGIAAALMERNRILLIDEPFNALDVQGVACVRELILEEKAAGALVVLACHDAGMLGDISDEIFVIEKGRITDHSIKESGGISQ